MRKAEAIRDKVMRGVGTGEAWVTEAGVVCMHWRKPLSLSETAQMAPTAEVRAREGRG
jgi:hypothetical protein